MINDQLDFSMIVLNTKRLIEFENKLLKISKTLDSGGKVNPDDIKALGILEKSLIPISELERIETALIELVRRIEAG